MVLSDVFLIYDSILIDVKKQESFSDTVIRLARERNMSSPAVYHGAGIDAKHYSKIISDRNYQPKKETVFAFAIVFKLTVEGTGELLARAGFTFNPSSKYDTLIKNFISEGVYDRKVIDEAMDELSLPLLPQKW